MNDTCINHSLGKCISFTLTAGEPEVPSDRLLSVNVFTNVSFN